MGVETAETPGSVDSRENAKRFEADARTTGMREIDSDVLMIVAGVVVSLVALLELYPLWRRQRSD